MKFIPQVIANNFLLQYKNNGLELHKSVDCDFYYLEVLDKPNNIRNWEIAKFGADQLLIAIVNFIDKWTREQAVRLNEDVCYITKHDVDLVYQIVQARLISDNAVSAEEVFYNPEKKEYLYSNGLFNVYVGCLADYCMIEKIEETDNEDDEDDEENEDDEAE